ncbi:MAG TPA: hypothetical protein DCP63_02865 [Bacteroidetes bacterium]|nr:hypothetical protein [Bacteroidota bacterium]
MRTVIKMFMVLLGLAIVTLSGCSDSAPSGPVASLGPNTVTKYVSVGNSLTQGIQSNALYESAQLYSFPYLIAQQLTKAGASIGTFEQVYYTDPGTPDATGKASRMEIISLTGPVIGPRGLTPGQPKNTTLTRPFDNLGIAGIPLAGFMDETGTYSGGATGQLVLRSQGGFPKSVYKHLLLLKPDLVTFWLGANDVLGFATSGGVSPSSPTPSAIFGALYTQALDSLRKNLPNARIVVANIPDVRAIPFFTTVGPAVSARLSALGLSLSYQKRGEQGIATGTTKLNEANPPMLTLVSSTYATLLGTPTGRFYKDNRFPALPPGIDTTKPFGLDPRNPWPSALILDPDEQALVAQATNDFNATINSVASAKGAAVVDFFSIFNKIKAEGYAISGEIYTTAYVSGGLFSLDGVHPSSRGYAIVANEILKVVNQKFGMSIPFVDVSQVPGIPAPLSKLTAEKTILPLIPAETFKSFEWMFRQSVEE